MDWWDLLRNPCLASHEHIRTNYLKCFWGSSPKRENKNLCDRFITFKFAPLKWNDQNCIHWSERVPNAANVFTRKFQSCSMLTSDEILENSEIFNFQTFFNFLKINFFTWAGIQKAVKTFFMLSTERKMNNHFIIESNLNFF